MVRYGVMFMFDEEGKKNFFFPVFYSEWVFDPSIVLVSG
jgi:hypothetical protein